MAAQDDFDVLVIGSGFGGSVTALRLAEKGYRVSVLEAGRRFDEHTLPETSWDLRNFLWAPRLGLTGIQRIHLLNNVVILAGAGVGGGSLNYANTLYEPPEPFFTDPQWAAITDWRTELAPYYAQAKRMLGVVTNPTMTPGRRRDEAAGRAVRQGRDLPADPGGGVLRPGRPQGTGPAGTGPVLRRRRPRAHRLPGVRRVHDRLPARRQEHPDHQLPGAGRTGRRHRRPADHGDRRPAAARRRLPGQRGAYRQLAAPPRPADLHRRAGGVLGRRLQHPEAAAPAAGRHAARISARLGELTRTNSEALLGADSSDPRADYTRGVAITSSWHPDPDTHIEPVRYGRGSNAMGLLSTVLTDGGSPARRLRQWLAIAVRRPGLILRSVVPRHWSERTIILLVMQSLDNSITVRGRRGLFGRFRLTSSQGGGEPNPSWIPVANRAARQLADNLGGSPGGTYGDLFNVPMTAHFIGGCPIGESAQTGVIDPYHRLHGYPGLHVVDGSALSANLGVNPSLSITALAERAAALWPNRGEPDPRPAPGEAYRRLDPVPPIAPVVPASAPAALRLGPTRLAPGLTDQPPARPPSLVSARRR